MTAKGNTKQEILDTALELFSVQSYESTLISQLAEAVVMRLIKQHIRQFFELYQVKKAG